MSHISPFGIIGFEQQNHTKGRQDMAQLHITLDEATLKDLMLGNRDQAVSKLLEEVFNAILKMEATEQLGAQAYERTEERQTYRNGYRTRMLTTRVGTLTYIFRNSVTGPSPPSSFAVTNAVNRPCS